ADEAHGFGGGGAIQHDDVVAVLAAELIDVHEGAEFFHAGEDSEFFGLHVVDAGGAQDADDVGGNLAPVAFNFLLDVDFVDGQFWVDGVRVAGLSVEEVGFEVECVGQAVRGIDTHDQGAIAQAGEFEAGCGGKTGFPNASFAAEEKDAHNLILALQRGEILYQRGEYIREIRGGRGRETRGGDFDAETLSRGVR